MGVLLEMICLAAIATGGFMAVKGRLPVCLTGRGMLLLGRRLEVEAQKCRQKVTEGEWVRRIKADRIDDEIYESISFLRNMVVLGGGRRAGADYIIGQLSQREGLLQPIFLKMLGSLRLSRKEEAMRLFGEAAGTAMGKEFGGLLLQWDEMDPVELTEILISHQKSIKETRGTRQKKRDEMISDLIYLPVVINVIVVLLNFVFVAYFMEQQELLRMMF